MAADLSEAQRSGLRERVSEAKAAGPFDYIRWLPEQNWHATLAFIGDRPESDLEGIISKIGGCLEGVPMLEGRPSRIQGFPHRNRPRLLAFKLYPGVEIQKLHWCLTQALGLQADRNFRLHVTVARFRDLDQDSARGLADAIKDLSELSEPWTFPAVTLYESSLKPSGAEYKAAGSWDLGR